MSTLLKVAQAFICGFIFQYLMRIYPLTLYMFVKYRGKVKASR